MANDDYERWECAKCGRERVQPSRPHDPPKCCGTTMWWQEFVEVPERRD